jgi:hypothetical protein
VEHDFKASRQSGAFLFVAELKPTSQGWVFCWQTERENHMTDLITLPNTDNLIKPPNFTKQPEQGSTALARALYAATCPKITMPKPDFGAASEPRKDFQYTPSKPHYSRARLHALHVIDFVRELAPQTAPCKQQEYLQSKSAMRSLARWVDGIKDPAILAVYKSTLQRIKRLTQGRR